LGKNEEIEKLKETALLTEKIIDQLKIDIRRLDSKVAHRDATIRKQQKEIE
jgi:hypothetical protein